MCDIRGKATGVLSRDLMLVQALCFMQEMF